MGSYQGVQVLLLICLCNLICSEKSLESPVIELKQGKLRGISETSNDGKEFFSFMGIPFAEPPVNSLRFEEPVKHGQWEGILEANKMPEMCLQIDMVNVILGIPKITGQEDCLYLNVFSPKLKDNANLPVMVYIHGGAYMCGSASFYGPHVLLNEEIVLVVIQYRLGIFGFLSTEDSSLPGNMGLKDQRMALHWVQENIRNFGGDPDQVTIFGESAGAGSVHLHMFSPGSKGLFKGVISQSGVGLCGWNYNEHHRKYAESFGSKVGCSLKDGSDAFKDCLQKIDGPTIVNTMNALYVWGTTPLNAIPRVDGDFLPDYPANLVKEGMYHKVNFITGVTRDEGGFFTMLMYLSPLMKKALIEDFDASAPNSIMLHDEKHSAKLAQAVYDFYLKKKELKDDPYDELTEMFSDCLLKRCYDTAARLHAEDEDINIYLYQLDHRGQRSLLDILDVGLPKHYIGHGDDLIYLFTGGPLFSQPLEREEDLELRRKLTKLWTNFAKFGNPTPPGSFDFVWTPATTNNFKQLSISTKPQMQDYPISEGIQFWNSLNIQQNRLSSRFGERVLLDKKAEL